MLILQITRLITLNISVDRGGDVRFEDGNHTARKLNVGRLLAVVNVELSRILQETDVI